MFGETAGSAAHRPGLTNGEPNDSAIGVSTGGGVVLRDLICALFLFLC